VHVAVEVPEPPERLVELREQARLVELVAIARLTIPAKPLSGETVMVEMPAMPVFTVTLVMLVDMTRS